MMHLSLRLERIKDGIMTVQPASQPASQPVVGADNQRQED